MKQVNISITPQNSQILLRAAEWIASSKRRSISTIRQLAETEENYLILIREHDRVEGQLLQAHRLHAEATLTLVEWLTTLNHFDWQCAYCMEHPLQIMSHFIPLPEGGTTAYNCVPACYRCRRYRNKQDTNIQQYLATMKCNHENRQLQAQQGI